MNAMVASRRLRASACPAKRTTATIPADRKRAMPTAGAIVDRRDRLNSAGPGGGTIRRRIVRKALPRRDVGHGRAKQRAATMKAIGLATLPAAASTELMIT